MAPTEEPIRVLIVGTDPLARTGLASSLRAETGVEVCGNVTPGRSPRALVLLHDAAALLWDVGPNAESDLPELDVPTVAVAVDEDQASAALGAGARGVLFRDGDGPRMAAALNAVLRGMVVLDERFSEALTREPPPTDVLPEPLTPREVEVLELMAMGLTNRELADRLGISVHTAKFHVNAVLGKLDATSRTEAVVRAARLGVLLL
jgi:DNA-binding NarL/FixJ family response regulator